MKSDKGEKDDKRERLREKKSNVKEYVEVNILEEFHE